MELYNICKEVAEIEDGLFRGTIDFAYDNMMCAMKVAHPADILDEILSEIGFDVFAKRPVELQRVKDWISDLEAFKKEFKVKELNKPIKAAKEYIKIQEGNENV